MEKSKENYMMYKLNKYIENVLDLSDVIEEYLTKGSPKFNVALKMKEIDKKHHELEKFIKEYTR